MTEDALYGRTGRQDARRPQPSQEGCASVAGALAENENVLEAWAGGSAGIGGLQRWAID